MLTEEAIHLGQNRTIGIITNPDVSNNFCDIGVITLNAGLIHRIGPNRLYVKINRNLAKKGIISLRFDFSTLGHNKKITDTVEKDSINETLEAIELMVNQFGLKKIILVGLCSGAEVAIRAASFTDKVKGLFLINGMFINESSEREIFQALENEMKFRYYRKYVFDYKRWFKIITAQSEILKNGYIKTLFHNLMSRPSDFTSQAPAISDSTIRETLHQLNSQAEKGTHINLLFTEGSAGYYLYKNVHRHPNSGMLSYEFLKDIDHVFTPSWSHQVLISILDNWIQNCFENHS